MEPVGRKNWSSGCRDIQISTNKFLKKALHKVLLFAGRSTRMRLQTKIQPSWNWLLAISVICLAFIKSNVAIISSDTGALSSDRAGPTRGHWGDSGLFKTVNESTAPELSTFGRSISRTSDWVRRRCLPVTQDSDQGEAVLISAWALRASACHCWASLWSYGWSGTFLRAQFSSTALSPESSLQVHFNLCVKGVRAVGRQSDYYAWKCGGVITRSRLLI